MPKGLTVEEVIANFTSGVTDAGRKWESRTLAGATRYADWINYWYKDMLSKVISAIGIADPWERSREVGTFTKEKARAYRSEKLRKLAAVVAGVRTPG